MKKMSHLSALGLLLAISACGAGGGNSGKGSLNNKSVATEPPFHGSCNQPLLSTCTEYVGTGWSAMPPRCGAGLADPNPCPSQDVLGRCNFLEMPLDADTRTYYYVGTQYQEDDVALLRSICVDTMKGTFDEL